MTFNLQRMVIGELLVLMLVLLVIYGRRRMGRLLYQLRRRSNTGTGTSSVLPISSAARGVLWMNAWKEFANDADFLRANGVGCSRARISQTRFVHGYCDLQGRPSVNSGSDSGLQSSPIARP